MIEGVVKSNKGIYIGDISYVMEDETYSEVWGDRYGYEDGIFEVEEGVNFAVFGTIYGDGVFKDVDEDYEFCVDAGVLGVVPMELIDQEKVEDAEMLGLFLDKEVKSVEVAYNNGYYEFDLLDKKGKFIDRIEINTDVQFLDD